MARCLVWCDFNRSSFDPACFIWYKTAFQAFPRDERCAFFTVHLCRQMYFSEPDLAIKAYREVLRPEWKDSKYWKRFGLSKRTLLIELAALYAEHLSETPSAELIKIVEAALDYAGENYPGRAALITFLCRAYQAQERKDEDAESAYLWVFHHIPSNIQNCRFLAELYRERGCPDDSACTAYRHMAELADESGDTEEGDRWTLLLADAYSHLGRVDSENLPTFERAKKLDPDSGAITAAYLYALADKIITANRDSSNAAEVQDYDASTVIQKLEEAVARESELRVVFEASGLEWAVILRALACAYAQQNRADSTARSLYARAIWNCPEDPAVWALHASALAEREDYSEGALIVYEKVTREPDCEEALFVALAHTYIALHAEKDKDHRLNAIGVWERLYQKGNHWPELITALADAYMGEGRVNDTAVSLWERQAVSSPENGMLRLRLAQELRLRGDLQSSIRYYKEAAALLPENFSAQFETGLVLKENFADYRGAIKLLGKAVDLPEGQEHLETHFALAEALLFQDRRLDAKAIFQTIFERIDPEHTPTLLYLAKLNLKYEEEGVRLAEALYSQASAISPDSAEAYRGMADLYREKGQSEEEEKALEKYLALSEPDADRYRQLADLYIRKGDFLRAESALRRVIALGQGDKQLYILLGEVILQGSKKAASNTD